MLYKIAGYACHTCNEKPLYRVRFYLYDAMQVSFLTLGKLEMDFYVDHSIKFL